MHLRFQSNTIFVLIIENFGLPIWIFVLFFFVLKSSCRRRNSSAYPDTFLRAWQTLLLGFCGQDYTHQLLSATKCTKCLNDFWLLPKHAWFNVFVPGKGVGLQDDLCHRNLPPCKRLLLSNSSRIALKMFRCLKFQLPLLLLPTRTSIIRFADLFFTAYTGIILCNVTGLGLLFKIQRIWKLAHRF